MLKEAHQRLLEQLDEAYAALREVHTDKMFKNPGARLYESANAEFARAQKVLFQCKSLWAQLEEE